MTFPLTPTVIVLGLSPADSDACTGTALPIDLSDLECRPFLPPRLTQLRACASLTQAVEARHLQGERVTACARAHP